MEDLFTYYIVYISSYWNYITLQEIYGKLNSSRESTKSQIEAKKAYLNNTYHANLLYQEYMSNIEKRIEVMKPNEIQTAKIAEKIKIGRGILNDLDILQQQLMYVNVQQIHHDPSSLLNQMKYIF